MVKNSVALAQFQSAFMQSKTGVKTVAITGYSGMIGTKLKKELESSGVTVNRIVTNYPKNDYSPIDMSALEGADAIIHLAGENVASGEGPLGFLGQWSDSKKEKILKSRVDGTAAIVDAMKTMKKKPKVFICASGVGYYGYSDQESTFTEKNGKGDGFLAEVCEAWETEANRASSLGVRTANLRFGVVLSPLGGAIAKLFPLFFLGGGGVLGSGEQAFSWVTLKDAARAIDFVLNSSISGAVNVVAPNPCTNEEFTKAFGAALGRPTIFPLPEVVGSVLFGQMGEEMLFGGQRAVPSKLEKAGFKFESSDIITGVKACLKE